MNFALVGCGNIAKKHAHVIKNYLKDSNIVAFCDKIYERAQAFGKEYDTPSFSSISEMMSELGSSIDVVNVLTPSGLHNQCINELVKYGKSIVVEKPIALRLKDVDEIIHTCDSNNVRLFVVYQNRYNTPIVKAHEALEQGRLGKLVMGTVRLRWKRDQAYYEAADWRGTWENDGGVFTNQASHHIDMLSWFMGDVESVKAVGITRLSKIECEDTGAALLKFTNGAIGIIEVTTATRPKDLEGSISILGEKGSIVIGGFFMNELNTWEFEDPMPEDKTVFDNFGINQEGWGYNLGEYLKGVVGAIKNGEKNIVDGPEGRKSLELISAIYESIETGNEIVLRFIPKKCKLGTRQKM